MSSNRHPAPLTGVVTQQGIPVGGLAIPPEMAAEFIQAFEREYQTLGMGARWIPGGKLSAKLPNSPDPQTDVIPNDPDSSHLSADS